MLAASRVIPILPIASVEAPRRIQVRSTRGVFTRWRWFFVAATQLVFFGLPWLQLHDRQAVLFDLEARRFYLFGAVLLPQDLIYLTGLLVASAMLLFLATVVAGRVWCGFACPQTVYTEMFLWIEQRLEGSRTARLRLDQSGWSLGKLLRRGGKHLAWTLLALATGFMLVGWFMPVRELASALLTLDLGFWATFWMLFYAGATYLHAGLLRERICQHACPYGRFQSSLLDRETLVVSYDQARGEPRGARPRGQDAQATGQGDCVDCTLCVQVCPTGIDIRQGLQAACIGCGVCIDACNAVMDKLRAPRGLIRFSPLQAGAASGWAAQLRRPRVRLYTALSLGLALLMSFGWLQRPPLRVDALRDRGVLTRPLHAGRLENVYRLQIMSAREQPQQLALRVEAGPGMPADGLTLVHHGGSLMLDGAGALSLAVSVQMAAADVERLRGQVLPIRFLVVPQGAVGAAAVAAESTFLVR